VRSPYGLDESFTAFSARGSDAHRVSHCPHLGRNLAPALGMNLRNTVVPLLLCTACVGQGKYDAALQEAQTSKTALRQMTYERDQKRTVAAERESALRELDASCREREAALATLQGKSNNLSTSLEQTKARLAELRQAHAAAEARAALFRELSLKFKRMVDDGQLSIIVRDGRMVLRLPNDVLFDTGRVEVKPKGQETLKAVAEVMKTLTNRHFQVSGHTDNVPIRTAKFASNWELSSGRALEVVHFLVAQSVEQGMLSAAGYSDVDPIAPNDNAEGKQKNRRMEISLQPMLDETVTVPNL
jgi:chemotaxis protein MotB